MKIPGYTLLERCGRGAYGDVYLALDAAGRRIALKVLAEPARSEREMEGLRSYAKLPDCPHLIRVHHIGEADGMLYYTMEPADSLADDRYLPASLNNVLARRGRFTASAVLTLGAVLLEAVQTLHAAKLVHRDIKPENILYIHGTVKLSDVGLLRSASRTLSLGGTLGFIPPEKLTSSPAGQNAADDLYALGKVLYCAWTGFGPERFPALPSALVREPEAARLNRVILTACDPDSAGRFHSADEFRAALEHGIGIGRRFRRTLRRLRPAMLPLAALLSATACLITLFLLRRGDNADTSPAPPPIPTGTAASVDEKQASRLTLQVGVDADNAVRQTFRKSASMTPPPLPPIRSAGWEILRDRFVNPAIWTDLQQFHVTVSAESLQFLPRASGALRLDRMLPERYRILFRLTLPRLEGELRFRLESPDGRKMLVWSVSGHARKYSASPLRLFADGKERTLAQNAYPVPWPRTSSRLELLRSDDHFLVILDGRIILSAEKVFAGGRFTIEADCGEHCDATLSHFQLFQLP